MIVAVLSFILAPDEAVIRSPPPTSMTMAKPLRLVRMANYDDIFYVFPEAARRAGVREGAGEVRCLAQEDGRLTGCTVTAEQPKGLGFGAAALKLASRFRMEARKRASGEPAPVVELPITLHLR